jgi:hypothetical protein
MLQLANSPTIDFDRGRADAERGALDHLGTSPEYDAGFRSAFNADLLTTATQGDEERSNPVLDTGRYCSQTGGLIIVLAAMRVIAANPFHIVRRFS